MKHALFLLVSLLLLLCACAGGQPTETTAPKATTESPTTAAPTTTAPPAPALADCRIIIPAGCDRYTAYAAELLRDAIRDACGAELKILRDVSNAAPGEITVGPTDRAGDILAIGRDLDDSATLVRTIRAFVAAIPVGVTDLATLAIPDPIAPTVAPTHPTLVGKLPVALTDQLGAEVAVVDLAAPDPTAPEALLWQWKATPMLGFNVTGYANSVDEAKLRYDARGERFVVCVTSSAGFFGVAEYPSGECIWNGSAKIGPHSIEWLPDGNVAVACSGNSDYDAGVVRIYTAAQGKQSRTYAEAKLYGAHGVLWDDTLGVLWALGNDVVCAYRIGGPSDAPTLTEVTALRAPMPHGGGHDLTPDPDAPGVLWVAGKNVLRLDTRTGKYTEAFSGDAYKSFGNFPGGPLVQTIATGVFKSHNTDTLTCLKNDGAGNYTPERITFPLRAFYKARIWAADYDGGIR